MYHSTRMLLRVCTKPSHPPTKAYWQFGAETGCSGNRCRPPRAAHSTRLGQPYSNLSSSAMVTFKSAVAKPAMNQP